MSTHSEPLVEGEQASLVLRAVLSFRIQSTHDGLVDLAGTGDAESMAALKRAIHRAEMRLVRSEAGWPSRRKTPKHLRHGVAFNNVARQAMRAYGMTVAPWQHQLS